MRKQEILSFFFLFPPTPNDVSKKRKLSELSCPRYSMERWPRDGLASQGWPGGPGGRRVGASRCEADLLPCRLVSTKQAAALGGQKKSGDSHLFQLVGSITSLGHSQRTGRWHRVTPANLENCFFFSLVFPLLIFFFLLGLEVFFISRSKGRKPKGCPKAYTFGSPPPPTLHGRYDIWVHLACPIGKRGDLLTFAFSQGARPTENLFVTNSGDLSGRG